MRFLLFYLSACSALAEILDAVVRLCLGEQLGVFGRHFRQADGAQSLVGGFEELFEAAARRAFLWRIEDGLVPENLLEAEAHRDDFGRRARHDGVGGHFLGDQRAGSDHGSAAYVGFLEEGAARSDPNVFFYHDFSGAVVHVRPAEKLGKADGGHVAAGHEGAVGPYGREFLHHGYS